MKKLLMLVLAMLVAVTLVSAEEPNLWPAYDDTAGLWGYIDETGAWAIAPQFEEARRFYSGCAVVSLGPEDEPAQGVIDTTGAFLLPPEYFVFDGFTDDAFFVMECCYDVDSCDQGWFYIPDRFFTGIRWNECIAFSDGPYVCVDGMYTSGLADRATGELVLPLEYTRTGLYESMVEEGYVVAERDDTGECELIRIGVGPVALPEGAVISYGEGVHEGLIPFEMDGQYGYLNTAGEIIIPAQYRYAGSFVDGCAAVGLWEAEESAAIIDRAGNVILTVSGVRWGGGYCGMVGDALWMEYSNDEWGLVRPDGTELCRFSEPKAWPVSLCDLTEDGPIWVLEALGDGNYAWRLLSREDWGLSEPIGYDYWVNGAPADPHPLEVTPGLWRYVDAYIVPVIGDVACLYAWPFEGALARIAFSEREEGCINRAGEVVYRWMLPEDAD